MTKKPEVFHDNIIFEKYLTDGNATVLKNQNLQLNYNLDFSNYLDMYLFSCNLGQQFCKITTHQLWEFQYPNLKKYAAKD